MVSVTVHAGRSLIRLAWNQGAPAQVADLCTAGLPASWPAAGENRTWPIPNKGAITPSQKPLRALQNGQESVLTWEAFPETQAKPRRGGERKAGSRANVAKYSTETVVSVWFPPSSLPGLLSCHFCSLLPGKHEKLGALIKHFFTPFVFFYANKS